MKYATNKGIFLNLFYNPKSDWLLVPGPFFFTTLPIKRDWVQKKK